jgi:hypothetical protein
MFTNYMCMLEHYSINILYEHILLHMNFWMVLNCINVDVIIDGMIGIRERRKVQFGNHYRYKNGEFL